MPQKPIPEFIRINQINAIPNIKFMRWHSEYVGAKSKAVVRCDVDGHEWITSINHLLNDGSRCPMCCGQPRWTDLDRIVQINKNKGISFLRWEGEYKDARSRAVVKCLVDGFSWSATVNNLVNLGSGCPQCAGLRKWTADEREIQINNIAGIRFVRWVGDFIGNKSKLSCKCCKCNIEWTTSLMSLMKLSGGCPNCALHGYNPSRKGTLYALRSHCGMMVKIGISNDYKTRHRTIKRNTPFGWSCIGIAHGDGCYISHLERQFHDKYEAAKFQEPFDGYTEWLVCTPELLEEIRSIANGNS